MPEFEFSLKYRLHDANDDPERHLGALAEAGCDDAIVGIGIHGRIALDFVREAPNAMAAIVSALTDVQRAIPDARLVEASPDLVGLTEIADLFGVSRQYARKLIDTRPDSFPEPVHEGKPALWHLSDVLTRFRALDLRPIPSELFDVARITMNVNLYRAYLNVASTATEDLGFAVTTANTELGRTLHQTVSPNRA